MMATTMRTTNNEIRRQFERAVRNAGGGILLLGMPEQRGEDDQPTGVPDAAGVLGLEVGNPQAVLTAYDARLMEAIEERLPIESFCIDMAGGRWVLPYVFRTVPTSYT